MPTWPTVTPWGCDTASLPLIPLPVASQPARHYTDEEGGSPSCCAAVPGSTTRITAARPTGTATTRTTTTPTTVCVRAVPLPQHPSPSELLEGIPAGAHEGSRPAQARPTAPRPQTWVPGGLFILMITSTQGSPNNIIHPTRARNTGFGKENFGRVMMSFRKTLSKQPTSVGYNAGRS